jgi:hypothetical protein
VHWPIPAKPEQLGDAARIAPVGLHGHRRQGRLHMPRLEQHSLEAGSAQPCMEPLRQWTRLKPNPADLQLLRTQEADQRLRLARHLRFARYLTLRIDNAHARQFQRHI